MVVYAQHLIRFSVQVSLYVLMFTSIAWASISVDPDDLEYRLNISSETPSVGDVISVEVTINHVDDAVIDRITGVSIGLEYNDQVLSYKGRTVSASDPFVWSTPPFAFVNRRSTENGEVLYADISELGFNNNGTGPGAVIRYQFEVIAQGESPLDFVLLNSFGIPVLPSIALLPEQGESQIFSMINSVNGLVVVADETLSLHIVEQPGGSVYGERLSSGLQAEVRDALGNRVTDFNSVLTLALEDASGSIVDEFLQGEMSKAASNGIVKFDELTVTRAGQFRLRVSAADDGVELESIRSDVFDIERAPLQVTTADVSKIFGEDDPEFTVSAEGFAFGESLADLEGELVFEREPGEEVGTYAITPSGLTSENYEITFLAGDLSIEPATVVVSAEDATKIYGEDDPEFTVSAEGFAFGESLADLEGELVFEREPGEEVGTYAITPSGLSSPNYEIKFVDGELTITPALLTILADDVSKVVGEDDPEFTVSAEGFAFGESLADLEGELAFEREPGEEVGTYAITPSGLSSPNYEIEFVDGELSILPAGLVVSMVDVSKQYGQADPEFSVTVSGFAFGESLADLEGELVFEREPGEEVGTYSITPSGLSSPNYEIEFVDGELTITPVSLTITGSFTVRDKIFDGTVSATMLEDSLVLDGVVTDDDVSLTGLIIEFTDAEVNDDVPVVISEAAIVGSSAGNYELELEDAPVSSANILADIVSIENSSIEANPELGLTANGEDHSQITVTARDLLGEVRASGGDEIFVTSDLGSLSPELVTDNEDGTYTTRLTSQITGIATVAAYAGTSTEGEFIGSVTVEFIPGEADADNSFAEVPDGATGEETPIIINVRDAFGNSIAGVAERLFVAVVDGPNSGAITLPVEEIADGRYTSGYTPLAPGTDFISILLDEEPVGESPLASEVRSTIGIIVDGIPTGVVNEPGYELLFEAEGGQAPYTWEIDTGFISEGLQLNSATGIISGTPEQAGLFEFDLRLTDTNGVTVIDRFEIPVEEEELRAVFVQSPVDGTFAGEEIGEVEVELRNQNNILAVWHVGTLSVEITEGTGGRDAQDAVLIGTTEQPVVDGLAAFPGLIIERSGLRYTLDGSSESEEVISGRSDTFTIRPGEPFQLDLFELEEVDDTLRLPEVVRMPDQGESARMKMTGNEVNLTDTTSFLQGSRLPVGLIIRDEFGNATLFEEGDTPVSLSSSSESGDFFITPTDTESIIDIIIEEQVPGSIIFYEDPIPGEPQLQGIPGERQDAREVLPDQTDIVIRNAETLITDREIIITEVNLREQIVVTLIDPQGERVNAPYPGLTLTLDSSSETGRFFTNSEGGESIQSIDIAPTSTRTRFYYEDSELGEARLTLRATGLPDDTRTVDVFIDQGEPVASSSLATVDDGIVNEPSEVLITLRDERNLTVSGQGARLEVSVTGGPNTGASFDSIEDLGQGVYRTHYIPLQSGVDEITVTLDESELSEMPLLSEVLAVVPSSLTLLSDPVITGQILVESDTPVTVEVRDQFNELMPDIPVRFQIIAEPQNAEETRVSNSRVSTDADGQAASFVIPGTRTGQYVLQVSVTGLDPVFVEIEVSGCVVATVVDFDGPCGPFSLEVRSDERQADPGDRVMIYAQLVDRYGNDVAFEDLEVEWRNLDGGDLENDITFTNSHGLAENAFTAGNVAGVTHSIEAGSPGNQLDFSGVPLDVQGDVLSRFMIVGPDTVQTGSESGVYTLILLDQDEQEILAPEDVAFRIDLPETRNLQVSTGSDLSSLNLSSIRRLTLDQGSSRGYFTVRQEVAGDKSLSATQVRGVVSATGDPVPVFFAPQAPHTLVLESGSGQSGPAGERLEDPLVARVADRFDNPLSDVEVSFLLISEPEGPPAEVRIGDTQNFEQAEVSSYRTFTDQEGLASVGVRLDEKPGSYEIAVESPGLDRVIAQLESVPVAYTLMQNYPNPFNGRTSIRFTVPVNAEVTIEIFDAQGRLVQTLTNGITFATGVHQITWDARRFVNGVYVYRMVASGEDGSRFSGSHGLTLMNH